MDNEMVVMSVVRVPPMGKLLVESLGARYESLAEVPDGAVRRMVTAAIAELVVFAGGYDKLVQAGLAPPLAGESSVPATMEERQAAFESAVARQMEEFLAESAPAPEPEEPLSIPDQINPLIEKHLAADPQLAGHTVRLEQDLRGNLRVLCDGVAYERPDLIEDPAIRRTIRAALSEWDRT